MVFDGIHFKVPAGLVAPRWHSPIPGDEPWVGTPQDLGGGAQSDIEMGGGDDEGNLSWEGIGGGDDMDGQDDQMKGSSVSGEIDESSSSDPSGSDYEFYRKEKEDKRNELKKRGKASSDTEEEDSDEDEELRDDVVDDFTPRRPTQKRQYGSKRRRVHVPPSPPRYSAKAKGKQRAIETQDPKEKGKQPTVETKDPKGKRAIGVKDPKGKGKQFTTETGSSRNDRIGNGGQDAWEDIEGDGEEREGGRGQSGENMAKVRSRLSREAIEEIEEFGKKIHDEADAIALRLRKDRTIILQLAGLSLSPARQPNFFNQFKTWYRQMHPQESRMLYSYLNFFLSSLILFSSVTLSQFTSVVREAYNNLWEGVDRDDPEESEKVMRPILDELEGMERQEELQMSPISRMKAIRSQVQRFVSILESILRSS
jgi:hypothetical protein